MLYKDLNTRHGGCDHYKWDKYRALYLGGQAIDCHIASIMPQLPLEDDKVYALRRQVATYTNYSQDIVDTYTNRLLSASYSIETTPMSDGMARLEEDADGAGTDLNAILRSVITEACVTGYGWTAVDWTRPSASSRAEYERVYSAPRIRTIKSCRLLDWATGDDGLLDWAVEHDMSRQRPTPGAKPVTTETWRVYWRDRTDTYRLTYDCDHPPKDNDQVPMVGTTQHGIGIVPLVCLDVTCSGLWIMDKIADPQIAHFRAENNLHWSMGRACYSVFVYKREGMSTIDGGSATPPPPVGNGSIISIGTTESMEPVTPSTAPYEVMLDVLRSSKDEIYRVGGVLSNAADNTAGNLQRSGVSKQSDRQITNDNLLGYGLLLKNYLERLCRLLASVMPVKTEVVVRGFDFFASRDVGMDTYKDVLGMHLSPDSDLEAKKHLIDLAYPDLPAAERDRLKAGLSVEADDDEDEAPESVDNKSSDRKSADNKSTDSASINEDVESPESNNGRRD